jgi:acyl-CoA thioester hydrolase
VSVRGEWRDGWFVVPHEVMFRDLDFFGHVNNAVYFTYFEWARTLLWFDLIGSDEPASIGFIVAHADCDFKQQIEMESIEIRVRVEAMRTSSLAFVYEIRKNRGQQLAAIGTVVVVLFDWTTRSKMRIPDELRRRIESHAGEGSDSPGSRAPAVS